VIRVRPRRKRRYIQINTAGKELFMRIHLAAA
jgi:hypothetical protein